MNTHTRSTGARRLAAAPVTTTGPAVISIAEVMLGSAAALASTAVQPSRTRWLDDVRAWWAVRADRRVDARRHAARRPDYLESAAMAREMHRL